MDETTYTSLCQSYMISTGSTVPQKTFEAARLDPRNGDDHLSKSYKMPTLDTSFTNLLLLSALSLACCGVLLAAYRLLLHPLSRFPGPKLAAATYWRSFYYDILHGQHSGREIYDIHSLHDQYGPIVRISPDELHVQDSDWFETLYNKGRREKWPRNHKANGSPGSIAQTVSRDLHRSRRAPLQPFFSKQAVLSLEHSIKSKVDLMCKGIKERYVNTRQILPIGIAFTALTLDVITEYCFGQAWNCLSEPDFAQIWKDTMTNLFIPVPIVKQFPWLLQIMNCIPTGFMFKLSPDMARMPMAKEMTLENVKQLIAEHESDIKKPHLEQASDVRDKNIFTTILNADVPASEKTAERLNDEGFVMVVAGGETTARALTNTIYHLLSHPKWLGRVRAEVGAVMPDVDDLPSVSMIEQQCPALVASVKEVLRLVPAATNRLQLYDERTALQYKDWVIPAGTPISMCASQVHLDPKIFENPMDFNPGRWLEADSSRLNRYYVPFSKGPRSCLGLNLAYVEMHLYLAAVLRRFDLELYDVDQARDIDVVRDCFIGLPSPDARPLRVKITSRMG